MLNVLQFQKFPKRTTVIHILLTGENSHLRKESTRKATEVVIKMEESVHLFRQYTI